MIAIRISISPQAENNDEHAIFGNRDSRLFTFFHSLLFFACFKDIAPRYTQLSLIPSPPRAFHYWARWEFLQTLEVICPWDRLPVEAGNTISWNNNNTRQIKFKGIAWTPLGCYVRKSNSVRILLKMCLLNEKFILFKNNWGTKPNMWLPAKYIPSFLVVYIYLR